MKHLLISLGCVALLSACNSGSGSLGGGSLGSAGSGNSAQSSGSANSNGSSSFGSKRTEEAEITVVEPTDPRAFVPVLKTARLERTKGGNILRVTGDMDRIGYYDLELVLIEDRETDAITYEARAAAPAIGQAVSTPRSRQVVLGTYLADKYRPSTRTVVIKGLQNTLRIKR